MFLADTHCHLDLAHFDADRDEALERARQAGVERILTLGTNLESSRQAVRLAETHPGVYAAVGVHPTELADFSAARLNELRALARSARVVAIGEIGIDLYWKSAPLDEQVRAFQAQLELAGELGLPVSVHDREAHAEVLEALGAVRPANGTILHSFSGDAAMAQTAVASGYYLGVDGPLTYKKNEALRAIFRAAPMTRILVETDAPYLPPHGRRGQRNEPAYVRWVAEKLAEIRGAPLAEVAAATTANAAALFRWE